MNTSLCTQGKSLKKPFPHSVPVFSSSQTAHFGGEAHFKGDEMAKINLDPLIDGSSSDSCFLCDMISVLTLVSQPLFTVYLLFPRLILFPPFHCRHLVVLYSASLDLYVLPVSLSPDLCCSSSRPSSLSFIPFCLHLSLLWLHAFQIFSSYHPSSL